MENKVNIINQIERAENERRDSWVIFVNGVFGSGKTTFLKQQRKVMKKSHYRVSPIISAPGLIELKYEDTKKNLLQILFPGWYLFLKLLKILRFILSMGIAFISIEWAVSSFKKIPSLFQYGIIAGAVSLIVFLLIFNEKFFTNLHFVRNRKRKKVIILLDDFDRLSLSELSICLKLIDWLKASNKMNFIITGSEKLFANQYSKLITGLPKIESKKIFVGDALTDKICKHKVDI